MTLLYFLTLFPLVPAMGMLLARSDRARDAVGLVGSGIIMAVTVVVAVLFFGTGPQGFEVAPGTSHVLSIISSVIDVILCAVILYNAFKYRNALTGVLGVVQLVGSVAFAAMTLPTAEVVTATPLYLDYMSVIMVLAVGIVGSLICVYALGYMKDFQAHDEREAALRGQTAPDRRPQFLALMFLFLSAMFVIVTSDNLEWLFCGWEITTVCSFLMIGYTRTPEAIKNAFTQIILNMLGGIAFLAGLMFLHVNGVPLTISGMIELSGAGTAQSALLVLPVVLLSIAALTKAAQMPFHTWLLGAMVAPTPTSALLHSSTMVKAGVFLMVKLSPLYATYPVTGFMVTSVGAITFLLAALMAISQSNAKRVLAYSTISNLGLISACLGVGAPEAVWAAIFLILFHTVAKSLLFLCVGTAEHHIGSRNIEDMDGMFSRMPHLTRLMMLGIMGMFVAPFGMLVSKWGALVAFAQTGNVLMIMVL
ncbi:MAG: hydrogenase, partial [Collinsella sp.]|nr:hydrogenase [Collinsella sp.]